jgi:hypothetical protein
MERRSYSCRGRGQWSFAGGPLRGRGRPRPAATGQQRRVTTGFDLPGGCPHYGARRRVLAAPAGEAEGTFHA